MKELIPVTSQSINETETLTCDGRALHEFLESKQHYADWMKGRIEKYGFVEGIDFICHKKMTNDNVCLSISHILSIDMAKQLAMVENNDKGAEVRRYFIACEQIAKDAAAGYKTKPRKSAAELNARSHAVTLRQMARMTDVYPAAKRAVFLAEAAAVLGGNPIERYLPAITDGRESWQSPSQLGGVLGRSSNAVGRALKALGLHAESDTVHAHSESRWNKARGHEKQVPSHFYNPDVVLPRLREYFSSTPASGGPLN